MSLENKEGGQPSKYENWRRMVDSHTSETGIFPDALVRTTHPMFLIELIHNPSETTWKRAEESIKKFFPRKHYADLYRGENKPEEEIQYLLDKSDPEKVRELNETVDLINQRLPAIVQNKDISGLQEIKEALNKIAHFHPWDKRDGYLRI